MRQCVYQSFEKLNKALVAHKINPFAHSLDNIELLDAKKIHSYMCPVSDRLFFAARISEASNACGSLEEISANYRDRRFIETEINSRRYRYVDGRRR